jgi:hypothetical protein
LEDFCFDGGRDGITFNDNDKDGICELVICDWEIRTCWPPVCPTEGCLVVDVSGVRTCQQGCWDNYDYVIKNSVCDSGEDCVY